MIKKRINIFLFILVGLFFPVSCIFAGTILSDYKYAWSNNIGYINFESAVVSDTILSGYAWSKNFGWIKFNPAQGGVLNDGQGNLSGHAWGEQLGWIDFENVSINSSTGKFTGTAQGTIIGTLNFDCPDYCDVRTDWRPAGGDTTCVSWTYSDWSTCSGSLQTRTILSSSPSGCSGGSPVLSQSCSSGGGAGFLMPPAIPSEIISYDQDLVVLPQQSGKYEKTTSIGKIIIEIPAFNVNNKTIFVVLEEPIEENNKHIVLDEIIVANNVFYNIIAKDENGAYVNSFVLPIKISLPLQADIYDSKNFAVYWFDETNSQWVLIPDAVFLDNKVVFQVNHFTKFAIFKIKKSDSTVSNDTQIKPILPIADNINVATSTFPIENNTDLNKKNKTIFDKIIDFIKQENNETHEQEEFKDNIGNNDIDNENENINQEEAPMERNNSWFVFLIMLILALLIFKKYKNKIIR